MAILHRQRHHLWHPLHSWTVPTERRPSQPKPYPLCRSALQPPCTIIPSHPRCSPIPPRHLLQHRQQQQSHRSSLQRNRKPKNQRLRYHQTRANRRLRGSYYQYLPYLTYRNRYLPLLYEFNANTITWCAHTQVNAAKISCQPLWFFDTGFSDAGTRFIPNFAGSGSLVNVRVLEDRNSTGTSRPKVVKAELLCEFF